MNDKDNRDVNRRVLLGLAAAAAATLVPSEAAAQVDGLSSTPITAPLPQFPEGAPAAPKAQTLGELKTTAEADADFFKRSPEEQAVWDELLKTLSSTEVLTSTGTSAGKIASALRRIESGFTFSAVPEDADFSFLHIEPLLDQAADLLDRGIRDRALADDQTAKMMQLLLEIHEFAALDKIHEEEETEGIYDVPYLQAKADLDAETHTSGLNDWYRLLVESSLANYYTQAAMDEQSGAAQKAAWGTGLVPYSWQGQNFAGYVTHTFGGVPATIAEMCKDAAFKQSYHRLFVDQISLGLQKELYKGAKQVADTRTAGLQARSAWDAKNRAFARRRTQASRRIEDIKARAAIEPDGSLNYSKRVLDIRERFHQDFREAVARLRVVALGLKVVYGYDVPLPSNELSLSYFDDCLLWTRRSIQWLIRFTRQEQSFILPISLREILGNKKWADGLNLGRWQFDLPEAVFPELAHVRLRGIGAVTLGDDNVLWRLVATAPQSANIRHLTGKVETLDQGKVPPCRMARVTTRNARLEPDVVGVSALHNASPIGKWGVHVAGSVPPTNLKGSLKDIVLDLHLAYRSRPAITGQT